MVTREDSPGTIDLSIQTAPGAMEKMNGGAPSFKTSFPHLGRLYEITRFVKQFFNFGKPESLSGDQGDVFANPDVIAKKDENQEIGAKSQETRVRSEVASVNQNIKPSNGEVLGDTSTCNQYFQSTLTPQITRVSGNTYKACWTITGTSEQEGQDGCDWSYRMQVSSGGRVYTSGLAFKMGINNCFTWGKGKPRTFTCDDTGSIVFHANPGDSVSLEFAELNGGNFAIRDANNKLADCKPTLKKTKVCRIDANGNPGTDCYEEVTPPGPVCGNAFFYTPSDPTNSVAIEDTINGKNQLDIVCTNPNPIQARVLVEDDQIAVPDDIPADEEVEQDETTNPDGTVTVKTKRRQFITIRTSRVVGIGMKVPYLEQIWDQVRWITESMAPIAFTQNLSSYDLEAKAPVDFSFAKLGATKISGSKMKGLQDVGVSPGKGEVYFPKLGGIQCSKIFMIKNVLPVEKFKGTSLDSFFNANCTTLFNR
jgi:hypothetical protein